MTCFVSEECVLPCSFLPGSQESIQWLKQDAVVYSFRRTDHDDDDDSDSHEEHFEQKQFAGRASVYPPLVSHGNATLILREGSLKDRGTYRCHVRTANSEHNANVILKVECKFIIYPDIYV